MKLSLRRNEEGSSFLYSANFWQRRINILSSHLSTSGLSSISALNTAILAMSTAAASWSKLSEIEGWPGSAKLRAMDVTRSRNCPDECW
jgi:hypothetical protein